jgi:hypothetical protein
VNITVKALPKKRKHQTTRNLSFNIPAASMIKYQALWYSAFIVLYIWFLYWVSYDFFVWHKPIAEINIVNYAGSIVSIAFIWAGTKIWKRNRIEVGKLPQNLPQKLQPKVQKVPQKTPQKTPAANNSSCTHYLGYLNQRQKSSEIPAECLTCKNVIQCFSSTK